MPHSLCWIGKKKKKKKNVGVEKKKNPNRDYFITWKWENEFCQQMAHLFPLTSMASWHVIYLRRIGSNGVKIEGRG